MSNWLKIANEIVAKKPANINEILMKNPSIAFMIEQGFKRYEKLQLLTKTVNFDFIKLKMKWVKSQLVIHF